jgi:hypothetical protein
MMASGVRKFALTTHVTSSVGWLGAVAAFLALAIGGLISNHGPLVQSAYIAMESVTWFVIVPFSIASLITGVVQALGTPWGLFRHYWVVAKLVVTVVATAILLVHTQPIGAVRALALQGPLAAGDLRPLRVQLVADAVAALFALLAATTLSVYKPWGLTAYGQRQAAGTVRAPNSILWTRSVLLTGLALLVMFVVWHLASGGMHGH